MALDSNDKYLAALADNSTKQILTTNFHYNSAAAAYNYVMNAGSNTQNHSNGFIVSTGSSYSTGGLIATCNSNGFPSIVDAPAGKKNYLSKISMMSAAVQTVQVHDLLWYCSGLSSNVTTLQTIVSPPALTRNTGGKGNKIFIYLWAAIGGTATTVTVKYTNSAGVSDRTGTAYIVGSSGLSRIIEVSMQAGDVGVLSVQSIKLSAATGSVGNIGVFITKTLTGLLPLSVQYNTFLFDITDLDCPELENGCALLYTCIASTSSINESRGTATVIAA